MKATNFTRDQNKLIVKRVFDAPLVNVWRAWTEAELLDQWWAPAPWKSVTQHMDFKEGGHRLYFMQGPTGEKHWGQTNYEQIIKPQRFTGRDYFSDETGKVNTALPVASFINQFFDLSGKTEVVITTTYPSKEDLQKVIDMGMQEGLQLAFQNLDQVLELL